MSVSISYVDVQEGNRPSITVLDKEYSGFSDAYLPKVGDEITVYSMVHHEQYQYRVKEIFISINEQEDHFDILLKKN